jgi:hypothetical protein
MPHEQKSNVHHSIEVSLKISTAKLQDQIQSDWCQITRPHLIDLVISKKKLDFVDKLCY